MGIYDRPYIRDEQRSSGWAGGRSLVINLIIINVVVWLAQIIFNSPQQPHPAPGTSRLVPRTPPLEPRNAKQS